MSNAAASAVPCGDVYPFPTTMAVAHVNWNPKWWDTTTTPLPWIQPNTLPYNPPAQVLPAITIGTGNYTLSPTQAEKSEIVLAVLLNVLMGKSYVELANRVIPDGQAAKIEFVYQESGLMIRIPRKMRFQEVVNALYEEFGNLRGRELK